MVDAYGGTVEKFIGDAVMAVFGVPVSHEDDPERAVRSALVMRSRLAGVAHRRGIDLQLRIGINTGLVVSGTNPGRDFLVTGEAVNVAARLQQAAAPGEILVGERTFRFVEPVVRTVAPRSLTLKGRTGPVVAYAVERMAPASMYRRRRREHGPFVGRDRELLLIRSLIEGAVDHRRAQLVTVVGEPGIGKTRLVEELVIELQRGDEPPAVWVGRCLPYGESGPYEPLRELLLRVAAVTEADSAAEARAKVAGHLLAILGEDDQDTVDHILRSVDPAAPGAGDRDIDDADQSADASREAWLALLAQVAGRRPTLLVIEDAHWAEPALLSLLETAVGGHGRVPLAVVCVARDDLLARRPGWGVGLRNETTVTLDALEEDDMARLALALSRDSEPPADAIALAGGNPFFLEEILAMSGESGGGRVPETVQGVIAARLDLLPADEKRLLQRAAVIGRTFDLDQVTALDGPEPARRLARDLEERGLLVRIGAAAFSFKHGLIRDVAYDSIPRSERAELHLTLARHLEPEPGAGRQVVAHHFAAAAGLGAGAARADAVRLLLDAAREARSVYAFGLALRQATLALSLADGDRDRALALEAAGDAHWMAERIDDSFESYKQALEAGERAPEGASEVARLRWKWVDIPTRWGAVLRQPPARELVDEQVSRGLEEARAAGDLVLEVRFLIASALTAWRFAVSQPEALRSALASADTALGLAEQLGQPALESAALDTRGVMLIALGRPLEARRAADRRLAVVTPLSRREEQMDAASMATSTRAMVGDYAGALEAADWAEQIAAGGDQGWLAWPLLHRAEALFMWDRWDESLVAYERFLAVYRATGIRRPGKTPARAVAVAVAVHLLRGDDELAELVEQRAGGMTIESQRVVVAHALLGRGDPELALERLHACSDGPVRTGVLAETLAVLERWDELDDVLRGVDDVPGLREMPRVVAQIDRARGVAGDEIALKRAADSFEQLGCAFEHARCLELQGHLGRARRAYERLGAAPALARLGTRTG